MKSWAISFSVLIMLSSIAVAKPRLYTAEDLSEKWRGQVHPGEKARGDEFMNSVRLGAFYIGCGAAVASFANDSLSKVFHNDPFAATAYRLTLDPNRAAITRHGAFADDFPQTSWGIAAFTTGRDVEGANQLAVDVTGLTLFDEHQSWTATASRGAFARTGPKFARLAGFPALAKMFLGAMSAEQLRAAHMGRLLETEDGDNPYRRRPNWYRRNIAIPGGGLAGQGAYILADWSPGFGTLVPAIVTGRRSPFPGYSDIGYGTDTRLLTEDVPLEQRLAFRLQFTLADTETNRRLRAEIPSWLKTVENNVFGTEMGPDGERLYPGHHLTAQFDKWMSQEGITVDYDVWMNLERADQRSRVIESPHLRFDGELHHVGVMSLLPYGNRYDLNARCVDFAKRAHAGPGVGYHLPVGDLAWYRSVGQLIGRSTPIEIHQVSGRYNSTAVGAYPEGRDLRRAPSLEQQNVELNARLDEFAPNRERTTP